MGLTDKHLVYGDDIPQTQMEKDYFWQVSKLKGEVMEERILKLEMKVERLESLVYALVSKITLDKTYSDADINGCRHTEGEQATDIATNASDIADNRTGIEESFEASLVNADDIADVRTALEEVYELIEGE